jgi:hypothetical protein
VFALRRKLSATLWFEAASVIVLIHLVSSALRVLLKPNTSPSSALKPEPQVRPISSSVSFARIDTIQAHTWVRVTPATGESPAARSVIQHTLELARVVGGLQTGPEAVGGRVVDGRNYHLAALNGELLTAQGPKDYVMPG